MKTMNEVTVLSKCKSKIAEIIANALIKKEEQGIKHSIHLFASEVKIPIELLDESTD